MLIQNLRTFLPSKDVNISKQFYLDFGFDILWQNEELIIFGDENYSFFLQKYYNKDWAENVMMQLFVDDLDSLYKVAKSLINKYEGIKVNDIFTADYGRTFHLIDPAGVLWHLTETKKENVNPDDLLCDEKKSTK